MIQKNIYELLNDVETDFTEYHEAQLLSDTDLKRLKKNVTGKIHRRQRLGTLAAAACAALFFGAFVIRPFSGTASEAQISCTTIQSYLGTNKDLTPYEQTVSQNDISKGIRVGIDHVILDDHTLFVSADTTCREHEFFWPSAAVTVNGTKKEYASTDIAGIGSAADMGQLMIMEYELEDTINTEKTLDIQLSLYDTGEDGQYRQWDFSFTVSAEKTARSTTVIPLDYAFSLPDGNHIRLTEMRCNDLRQIICYESDYKSEDHTGTTNWYLEGTDNRGNPILFTNNYSDSEGGFLQLNKTESTFSHKASSLTLEPIFSRQKPLSQNAATRQKILRQIGKVFPEDWTHTSLGSSFQVKLNRPEKTNPS